MFHQFICQPLSSETTAVALSFAFQSLKNLFCHKACQEFRNIFAVNLPQAFILLTVVVLNSGTIRASFPGSVPNSAP